MLNYFLGGYAWYRRWAGGHWVYWHFIGWRKVLGPRFHEVLMERGARPDWSFENWS